MLLLVFELETSVPKDRLFTKRVIWTLHGIRTACYVFIVYTAYGYLSKLVLLYAAVPLPGVSDLSALVDGRWAYAVDFDDYEILTAANCRSFSATSAFLKYPGVLAVVDRPRLADIIRLAWVDMINASVWLLVVLNLEIEVRLQERQRRDGTVLKLSNLARYLLYSVLFLAAAYWGVEGDFVDFCDAFLWLIAFIFIELNVLEWRQESAPAQIPVRPSAP